MLVLVAFVVLVVVLVAAAFSISAGLLTALLDCEQPRSALGDEASMGDLFLRRKTLPRRMKHRGGD